MIDIEQIKGQIVECLKPLNPDKIILFGSYATGQANEDSDIDLFLVNNSKSPVGCEFDSDALLALRGLIRKYKIGFDVFTASESFLNGREDYFYKTDLWQNGVLLYAK